MLKYVNGFSLFFTKNSNSFPQPTMPLTAPASALYFSPSGLNILAFHQLLEMLSSGVGCFLFLTVFPLLLTQLLSSLRFYLFLHVLPDSPTQCQPLLFSVIAFCFSPWHYKRLESIPFMFVSLLRR